MKVEPYSHTYRQISFGLNIKDKEEYIYEIKILLDIIQSYSNCDREKIRKYSNCWVQHIVK